MSSIGQISLAMLAASLQNWIILVLICGIVALITLGAYVMIQSRRLHHRLLQERKHSAQLQEARHSLAENAAMLRAILRSVGDGLITTDRRGRVTFLNPVAQELIGWDEDAVGKKLREILEVLDGRTGQPVQDPIRTVLHEGTIMDAGQPLLMRTRSGDEYHISQNAAPIRSRKGKTIGVVITFRDVSEEVRKARALAESEQRYRQLFDTIGEGFALHEIVCDAKDTPVDYRFVEVNPAFERLTGLNRDAVVGRTVREVIPDIEPVWIESYGRVAMSGEPEQFEQHSDALGKHFEVIAFSPRPGFFATLFLDVSLRVVAHTALIHEQNLLRSLMDQMPDSIYFKDRQSRFTRINKSLARTFGLADPAEAIGKTDYDFFAPEHAREAKADEDRVIATGRPVADKEERETWPDGRVTWVSSTKAPLRGPDGRIVGTLGISRDVTLRKQVEEQLRQAQKMEAVGQLAGGIAHDFNNQLTVIRGYCDLLLASRGSEQSIIESIREVRAAAQRSASLTSQLLAFSRKQMLRPEALDLTHVLREMCGPVQRLVTGAIRVATLSAPEPAWVWADPIQVQQAVMNIALNARDAMPDGGTLVMEAANVDMAADEAGAYEVAPGPYVRLRISDSGTGMDARTCSQIFEPFFTTKPEGQGTGLGLAMVYGFVKQSGGAISVESTAGVGTIFEILLPRASVPNSASDGEYAPEDLHEPVGTETVILAEDDDSVRLFLAGLLRKWGYAVIECPHPRDALQHARKSDERIELLVADVVMPGLSGIQLACELLSDRPEMRVLLISAYPGDELDLESLSSPEVQFLSKPFTPAQLARAVRETLGLAHH